MKVERKKGLAWRKVGDETVVIHLGRHRIFGLETAAGRIWDALAEPQEIAALESIAAEDSVDSSNVLEAVHRFVADLLDEDLIEVSGEDSSEASADNLVDFPSPRIEWREDLQQFAGQCRLVPGQSGACTQYPGNS